MASVPFVPLLTHPHDVTLRCSNLRFRAKGQNSFVLVRAVAARSVMGWANKRLPQIPAKPRDEGIGDRAVHDLPDW